MRQRSRRLIGVAAIVGLGALGLIGGCLGGDSPRRAEAVAEALRAGRLDEATTLVEDWTRQAPTAPEAHAWHARLAIAEGRIPEAAEAVNTAQRLGLAEPPLRELRGILLAYSGHYPEAERLLRLSLDATDEPRPLVAKALAKVGIETFRFGTAREAIERWKRDAPNDPQPYLWEAEVGLRIGSETQRLVPLYRAALQRDPESDEARLGLAEALRKEGQLEDASRLYEDYLTRHPEDANALTGAGLNALERGDPETARQRLEAALQHDPRALEALKGLGRVALASGDLDQARDALERAWERDPQEPQIAYQLALIHRRLGNETEAERYRAITERLQREIEEIRTLRDALVEQPNNVDRMYEAARWLIEHGQPEEALRWTKRILSLQPSHSPTCRLLADHYRATGDLALANYYELRIEDEEDAPHSPRERSK